MEFNFSTMSIIERHHNLTMPSITVCSHGAFPEDVLISCEFGFEPKKCFLETPLKRECNRLDLNEKKPKVQLGDGFDYGVTLHFFNPNNVHIHFGITDTGVSATDVETDNPINPGIYRIAITKTKQKSLSKPYSNCKKEIGYRQIQCIQECSYRKITESCGCQYPEGCPLIMTECGDISSTQYDCKINECPVECEQVSFEFKSIVYSSLGEEELWKRFKNSNITQDEFMKKFTAISFYYDRLETIMITQMPTMSLVDLVSSVGGLLGN